MEPTPAQRVLVRAPNWVGDVVMATRAFARIRAGFPGARITCGLRPHLQPLLAASPYFDEFLPLPKARGARAWGAFFRQVRELRRRAFDLAIVLPNSLSTGCLVAMAGIPVRLGYRQGRPFTMTHGLAAERNRGTLFGRIGPKRVPTPMPLYYDALLDVLGLPPAPGDAGLHTSDAERAFVAAWLGARHVAGDERLVLLNPGASFGPSKLWVEESWAGLAAHHRAAGRVPIVLAGPGEEEMARRIAARAGVLAAIDPILSLAHLKALVERAALLVSTDTGPRHIAVGLGVPVVCLMGPNDRRYTDYALDRQVVIQKDLDCVPCQRKVCPLGHHRCMREITVEEVAAAGESLVGA